MTALVPSSTLLSALTMDTTAACRYHPADLWFPDDPSTPEGREQARRAIAICQECPLKVPCLAAAIEAGEDYGIWGGMRQEERGRLIRKSRAA